MTYRQVPSLPRRATSVAVPRMSVRSPSAVVPEIDQSTMSRAMSSATYTWRGRTSSGRPRDWNEAFAAIRAVPETARPGWATKRAPDSYSCSVARESPVLKARAKVAGWSEAAEAGVLAGVWERC